jgi:predicted nucleotidyltransferase
MKRTIGFIILAVAAVFIINTALAVDIWDTKYIKVTQSRSTSDAQMAVTLAPSRAFRLIEVRIHLDAASATPESVTITLDSSIGTSYDAVLLTQSLNTYQDFVWVPDNNRYFTEDDEIDFAYLNSEGNIWGLEVLYEETFERP